MSHPIDRYFRKHQHYPRVRIDNGVQRLTVEFHPGYVRVATSSPFSGEVYITRSTWFKLLKEVIPLTKWFHANPAPDFDVPRAVRISTVDEMEHLREKRAMKKAHVWDHEAAERQRKRFLAARARASRKQRT